MPIILILFSFYHILSFEILVVGVVPIHVFVFLRRLLGNFSFLLTQMRFWELNVFKVCFVNLMVLPVSHLIVIYDFLDVEFPSFLRLVFFIAIQDYF